MQTKVYYRLHNNAPCVPVPRQINPVEFPPPPSYILKANFNIIIPSTSAFSKCSFSVRSSHQTLYKTFLSPISATCRIHLFLLNSITRIIFGDEYRSWSYSLCSLLHSLLVSFLLGQNIFPSSLFSTCFLSFLALKIRFPHPHTHSTPRPNKRSVERQFLCLSGYALLVLSLHILIIFLRLLIRKKPEAPGWSYKIFKVMGLSLGHTTHGMEASRHVCW